MADPIKLSSGRWEIRYRDPNGRPRQLRFDTKGAANDHLGTVRTKGIEGSYIAPERGRITFGSWCDEWWATKVDLRARTLARYERDLRLHIRPRFDRRPLAKITKTEVQAWVAEMRSSGVPDSAVLTRRRSKRSAGTRPTRRRWTSTDTCSSPQASGPPRRWRRCIGRPWTRQPGRKSPPSPKVDGHANPRSAGQGDV